LQGIGLDFEYVRVCEVCVGVGAKDGAHTLHEGGGCGAALFELGELAVRGVFDDAFGDGRFVDGVRGLGVAQVLGGDLEAVDEEPGALGIDGVAGHAAEDLGQGELDGGVVVEPVEGRELEAVGRLAAAPVGKDRDAVSVVVVAEGLAAERAGAATAAIDEDVAAEVGLALGRRLHGLRVRLRSRLMDQIGLRQRVDFEDRLDGGEFSVRHASYPLPRFFGG
jgi:hypothetical protein